MQGAQVAAELQELGAGHNITFADRETGKRFITERLGSVLLAAGSAGQLAGWWFMNKQPWPLRYRATEPSPLVESTLSALIADGSDLSWLPGIYEPETTAFGGTKAMDAAHDLFHQDSRHLLTYEPGPGRLGRRETAVLLLSSMMRAAGLDWFEQGDVWAKVADLRPAVAEPLNSEKATAHAPAMRKLMTIDAHSLCRPGGPLDGHTEWVAAFERAGTTLADLATHGGLTRGLRSIIAHHAIFHANRAGLHQDDQHAISHIAREVVMGASDSTASPTEATPETDSVSPVNTDTLTPHEANAERLRNALVDKIRESGYARTPAVEHALRNVERHLFVPDAPLEQAYANAPVNINAQRWIRRPREPGTPLVHYSRHRPTAAELPRPRRCMRARSWKAPRRVARPTHIGLAHE
ncbi:MAG: hypothetical protein HOY75_36540 [Streptomyces sp.]|nr:hypothetical protein [Streptomyces sp.]